MRGQGLGPGFTRAATRRSVIFKLEGLELVFMVFEKTSVASPASIEPPSAIAEAFNISRRPSELSRFLFMALSFSYRQVSQIRLVGLLADRNHLREYALRQDFPFDKS